MKADNNFIDIEGDVKAFEKQLKGYQREAIPKSVPPALNRTGKSAQSAAIKKLSQITKLKQKDVRKAIAPEFRLASRNRMYAVIDARQGRAVNLIKFVTPARQNPRSFRARTKKGFKFPGVVANPWGKRRAFPGTFIGRGAGHGKMMVFKRGPGNKVQAVYGPSIRKEFEKLPVKRVMIERGKERFPIEFKRVLDRNVARINQRYKSR